MLGLAMIVGGVVAFRFDTNIVGFLTVISFLPGEALISYTSYTHHWLNGRRLQHHRLWPAGFLARCEVPAVVDHRLTSEAHETVHVTSDETVRA